MTLQVDTEASSPAPAGDGARPSRRRWFVGAALAVVFALLIGYGAGLVTPHLRTPGNDSPEAGFARDMTTHHTQAVEMGFLAFEKGNDAAVKTLGADIASGQQGDIGTMQTWLRMWHLDPTGTRPRMAWMPDGGGTIREGLMPGMATREEMTQLRAASGRDFDLLFLQLMINHHLGGIHMVDAILTLSHEDDVVNTAQTMRNTQTYELTHMQNLRKEIEARTG